MTEYNYTTYRTQSVWESLIGKSVEITWRESDSFGGLWTRYRVVTADTEWILLQGLHEPDEITGGISEYIGGPIVVRLTDIELAEIIE